MSGMRNPKDMNDEALLLKQAPSNLQEYLERVQKDHSISISAFINLQ